MDHEEYYSNQQEEEEVDVFDLLPDALVLEIFNRVEDARSLSACTILCKRFGDLVTQTQNVSLEITRRNKVPEVSGRNSGLNMNKSRGFLGRFLLNPIHSFLNRMVFRKLKSKSCSNCSDDDEEEENSFRLPNELLNNFKEIRSLAVKLPGLNGDISSENGSGALLKWKAEFGKELESCVILGATGFQKSEVKSKNRATEIGKNGEISSSPSPATMPANLTNKQLKKRVVWTISCLIASSARHHMLKQIVSLNRTIKDVKISDGSKQGTIEMTEKQVADLREDMNSTAAIATAMSPETAVVEPERTKVPAVTIKMWYLPVIELPESGCVMKGATLAVIRPAAAVAEKDDDVSLAMGAFEEKCIGEAVRKLIDRKKSYTLEMNSF